MFDADSSSLFLGADTSFPKEAELAKRLVHICFEQLSFKQLTSFFFLFGWNILSFRLITCAITFRGQAGQIFLICTMCLLVHGYIFHLFMLILLQLECWIHDSIKKLVHESWPTFSHYLVFQIIYLLDLEARANYYTNCDFDVVFILRLLQYLQWK